MMKVMRMLPVQPAGEGGVCRGWGGHWRAQTGRREGEAQERRSPPRPPESRGRWSPRSRQTEQDRTELKRHTHTHTHTHNDRYTDYRQLLICDGLQLTATRETCVCVSMISCSSASDGRLIYFISIKVLMKTFRQTHHSVHSELLLHQSSQTFQIDLR